MKASTLTPSATGASVSTSPTWSEVVHHLGAEMSTPLSHASDRLQALMGQGQASPQELKAVRDAVLEARQLATLAQQIARLAAGRLRVTRERLQLAHVARQVLNQRQTLALSRGVPLRSHLDEAVVMSDGALLFGLLNGLLDWALSCTHSSVELRIEHTPWPVQAQLKCRFAYRPLDLIGEHAAPPVAVQPVSVLHWQLVQLSCQLLGIDLRTEDEAGIRTVTLGFPETVMSADGIQLQGYVERPPHSYQNSGNSKPLAGSHLLLVSPRLDWRESIQGAIQHMGVLTDSVNSVTEAATFCEEGVPHAVVFEHALRGPALQQLHQQLMRSVPDVCFIEVFDGDHPTLLSQATSDGVAQLGRTHLEDALPTMLLFELTRSL